MNTYYTFCDIDHIPFILDDISHWLYKKSLTTYFLPQLATMVILETSVSSLVILCCMDYGVCQYVTAQKRTVIIYMVAAISVEVRIIIGIFIFIVHNIRVRKNYFEIYVS